jgi:hypothetical protein
MGIGQPINPTNIKLVGQKDTQQALEARIKKLENWKLVHASMGEEENTLNFCFDYSHTESPFSIVHSIKSVRSFAISFAVLVCGLLISTVLFNMI